MMLLVQKRDCLYRFGNVGWEVGFLAQDDFLSNSSQALCAIARFLG
jgi:hypothetical protein